MQLLIVTKCLYVSLCYRSPNDPPLHTLPQTLSLSVLVLTKVHQQLETLLVSRRHTSFPKQQLEMAKQE